MNMKNIIELTETDFETEVLKSAGPVLVDFYAPWCGPCQMLAPLLEQLAGEGRGLQRQRLARPGCFTLQIRRGNLAFFDWEKRFSRIAVEDKDMARFRDLSHRVGLPPIVSHCQ